MFLAELHEETACVALWFDSAESPGSGPKLAQSNAGVM